MRQQDTLTLLLERKASHFAKLKHKLVIQELIDAYVMMERLKNVLSAF